MKKTLIIGSCIVAGLALSSCSGADGNVFAPPKSSSYTPPSPSFSVTATPSPNTQLVTSTGKQALRDAVGRFDATMQGAGGVSFTLVDPQSKSVTTYQVNADDSGAVETVTGKNAEKTMWTPTDILSPAKNAQADIKKTVMKLNPKAEWYSEPRQTPFLVPTPDRLVEDFLSYSTKVECRPINEGADKGGQQCTITAVGIGQLPGLGGFQTPEKDVVAYATLNKDGDITAVTIFPGNNGLERQVANVKYGPNEIAYPDPSIIVTMDAVGQEIAKTMPAPSTSGSPQASGSPAAGASSAAPSPSDTPASESASPSATASQ